MQRFFRVVSVGLILAIATLSDSYAESKGDELFEMERYRESRDELKSARGESRKRVVDEIDYRIAVSEMMIGGKESELLLKEYVSNYPATTLENDALYRTAIQQSSLGDMASCEELLNRVDYNRLNKIERDNYDIRVGYQLFRRGNYPEVLHYISKIKASSPNYVHALYMRSYIEFRTDHYAEAKRGFSELKEFEIYADIVPFYLMQIAFNEGDYRLAIEYGESLIDKATKGAREELARTIAEAYFRLGDSEKTIAYLERSLAEGEEMSRYEYYIKGFSLHQLERYAEAAQMLKRACGADDEMTQNASFHLANCYLHLKDMRGALRAFAMASNDKFNEEIAEEALFNYAKLQYELDEGVFNETINVLSRYLDRYDNAERRVVIQSLLVAAYYNSKNYAAAYENITKIKDPDAEVRAAKQRITYLRGAECFIEGDMSRAKRFMDESIAIGVNPKYIALATFWLGEIAYKSGNYSEAQQHFNNYLARAPKGEPMVAMAEYNIANTMFKQGSTKSAIDYFEGYGRNGVNDQLIRFDSYNRVGDIYYQDRLFAKAVESYNRANAIDAEISNYPTFQIATIKGVMGDHKAKIALLSRIKSGDLLDESNYQLGRSYILTEQYQKAIDQLERYIVDYEGAERFAEALSDLGVAYINMKNSAKALEYYDRAIKSSPQSQVAKSAMEGVREIYINQGDAKGYFSYAKSMGMEGDLSAVARDSLSFASARAHYLNEGSKGSRAVAKSLSGYIKDYPKGYYLNDALFYLSDTYIKLNDNKEAIATLTTLSSRGAGGYSERVYSMLSDLTFDEKMYKESVAASMKLYDVSKDYKKRMVAMERSVEAARLSGDEALDTQVVDKVLKMGELQTGAEAQRLAKYIKATRLRERGEREDAVVFYRDLAADKLSKHSSEANFYVIDDTFRRGERDEAEEQIFALAEIKTADPYWLAKAFLLLGDIYVLRDDSFQARATYQSIVDGYSVEDDGIIDEAKSKIEKLK
ncbi:MAG: tetratricopeptide repeat protein [Rikenellaceae bacterium]